MIPLIPEEIYHIYNHAVGDDNLFRIEENYAYFLKRYAFFIHPVARTYTYCLMPNHFHLLVKIRSKEELHSVFAKRPQEFGDFQSLKDVDLERKISKQFSNFFNSYTKSYNKYFNRRGALFCHNFKRKHINQDTYFTTVVQYIHHNPIHHGFCSEIEEWKWSSYHSILSNKITLLEKYEIIDWFGDKVCFTNAHKSINLDYVALEEEYC